MAMKNYIISLSGDNKIKMNLKTRQKLKAKLKTIVVPEQVEMVMTLPVSVPEACPQAGQSTRH